MSRQPQPRRITLGGHEVVALTPAEYEQLMAGRRQIGGQSARVRVLAHQAKRTERLLRALEDLVSAPPQECHRRGEPAGPDHPGPCPTATPAPPGTVTDCLRCAVADLLRGHRGLTP